MKTYQFGISITGSAKGTVKAENSQDAKKKIIGGQWEEIDIDVENVDDVSFIYQEK